jgi:hypothetical protein
LLHSHISSLNIGFINLNCLSNKIDFLKLHLNKYDLQICGIAETWLLPSVPSSFVTISGYSLVRGDTDGLTRKHGVCFYVSDKVRYIDIEVDLPNLAGIHLTDVNVWCLMVYRPPSYSLEESGRLLNYIKDFSEGREVVVVGDFNLPSVRWSNYNDAYIHASPSDRLFLEGFNLAGLTQLVTQPTFVSGSVLDLVLTSETDRVGDIDVLAPFPHCMHSPVIFQYFFFSEVLEEGPAAKPRYLWHRGKFNRISEVLDEVDWEFEFAFCSVDDKYIFLQTMLLSLIERFVPQRRGAPSQPWSARPSQELLRQRSQAWESFKLARRMYGRNEARTVDAYHSFVRFNNECRNCEVVNRSKYEAELIDQLKDHPKLFHSYIRKKKTGSPTIGPIKQTNGNLVSDPLEMCNIFVSKFASIFISDIPQDPAPYQQTVHVMGNVTITLDEVLAVLSALDANSSMGPDGLHPCLLKSCATSLAYPLWSIFNQSLNQGCLPVLWKQSLVVPIFKSKSRFDPGNYRPVSLTSVCCKSMERIIVSHLINYLEGNNLLSEHQFGFRKNRSTEDQLLLTYNDISGWVDEGLVVDLILLDFSKAFDLVAHSVLLDKLSSLGISNVLVQWIREFLVGRVMQVSCGGVVGSLRDVTSGVPQGSVLGPVLFLIYINSVANDLSCSFKVFADDFKLYMQYSRKDSGLLLDSIAALQADLDRVQAVSFSWNLVLNPGKCVAMRFSRGNLDMQDLGDATTYYLDGVPLPFVDSHKDLGVLVDTKLRFHQHILSIVGKASGLANNLLRSTVNRSPQFMMALFKSHIRPILDYCCCVWNSEYVGNLRMLEAVQRRWTKRVEGLSELSYAERLDSLNLFSICGRLLRADLIKHWKAFHSEGSQDVGLSQMFVVAPQGRTRGHPFKLSVPRCSTDIRKRFFSCRHVMLWTLCLMKLFVQILRLSSRGNFLIASLSFCFSIMTKPVCSLMCFL